jgi:hypothetical protein
MASGKLRCSLAKRMPLSPVCVAAVLPRLLGQAAPTLRLSGGLASTSDQPSGSCTPSLSLLPCFDGGQDEFRTLSHRLT